MRKIIPLLSLLEPSDRATTFFTKCFAEGKTAGMKKTVHFIPSNACMNRRSGVWYRYAMLHAYSLFYF